MFSTPKARRPAHILPADGARVGDGAASDAASGAARPSSPISQIACPARLAALAATGLLDTPAEPGFDRFTRLAAALLRAPVALVSLLDAERLFVKSAAGLPPELAGVDGMPVEHSLCRYVVDMAAPFAIEDAAAHPLARDLPAVRAGHVGAYLGVPLTTASGETLGSLCVVDARPRAWSPEDRGALGDLAVAVMTEVELRGAMAAQRASAQRYRLLFEANPLPMWVFDTETLDFLAVNDAAVAQYGYAREEFLRMTIRDIRPAEDVPRLLALHANQQDGRTPYQAPFRHRRKDGTLLDVEVTVHTLTFAGRPAELVLAHDVTARVRAEAALRASEAEHRALVEALPVVVYRVAPEPPFAPVYVSPSVEAFGYPHADWMATPDFWLRLVHPEDRARVLAETAAAQAVGRPLQVEYRLVTRDGSVRWVHDRGDFLCDAEGRPLAWQGVMLDVTERKAAEAALRESEARAERIAANVPGMVYQFALAPDGTAEFRYVSDGARDIVGVAPEAVRGNTTILDALHPDERPAFDAAVAESARALTPYRWEGRIRPPVGGEKWIQAVSRPARLADGTILWDGVLLDVTARKHAEAARAAAEAEVVAREARFRALIEHARDIVGVVDVDGTILYESPAVERVLGYHPTEMVGRPAGAYVHADDQEYVRTQLAAVLAHAGAQVPVTYRCRHRDGSWRTLEGDAWNLVAHPAVGGIVVNVRDVTERRALEDALTRRAFHDPLTGLANRERFRERLEQALAGARAAGAPGAAAATAGSGRAGGRRLPRGGIAVLYLDLDGFKTVNDSLGHAVGDDLLVIAAERLRSATRGCDTVARLGGDEFAVLLEGVRNDEDACVVAERVVQTMRTPIAIAEREVVVSASVGIVRATGAETAEALLRDADAAMYRAKRDGRNCASLFTPALHAAAVERLELEADLRHAAERGELTLAYQPVVDLATGRVTAVEALARWHHPRRGAIRPDQFIPIAEETGLIVAIGRWVLTEACRTAATWAHGSTGAAPGASDRVPAPAVTVNVSGRQLQDAAFPSTVAAVLAESGLPPHRLVLEITESVLVSDTAAALERLAALKGLGVTLAVDDFGTGYSSLAYLHRFPIDVLKLDRAFVSGVASGGRDAALARVIVTLGAALGLRTVAEGIETAEQLERLRRLGCELGQGYLFARPMPADSLWSVVQHGAAALPLGTRRCEG